MLLTIIFFIFIFTECCPANVSFNGSKKARSTRLVGFIKLLSKKIHIEIYVCVDIAMDVFFLLLSSFVGWLAPAIREFLFHRFGLLCIVVARPRRLPSTPEQRLRSRLFYPENVDIQLNRIPLTLKTLCCFFTAFPLRILRLFAYLFLISELGFKIVLLFWCTFHTQKKVRKNERDWVNKRWWWQRAQRRRRRRTRLIKCQKYMAKSDDWNQVTWLFANVSMCSLLGLYGRCVNKTTEQWMGSTTRQRARERERRKGWHVI